MGTFAVAWFAVVGSLVLVGCGVRTPADEALELSVPPVSRAERAEWWLRTMLTERQVRAVTPVIESLADALAEIAPKYPELAGYRKEAAKRQSECNIGLSYTHNFAAPHEKRGIRPSDFGRGGFFVKFSCAPIPRGYPYQMSKPTERLRNLQLYVWTGVRASPDASPGLADEIGILLRAHAVKLVELDRKVPSRH